MAGIDPQRLEVGKMYDVTAREVTYRRDVWRNGRRIRGAGVPISMPGEGMMAEGRPHIGRMVLMERLEHSLKFHAPDDAPNQWIATVQHYDLLFVVESDPNGKVQDS